MIHANIITGIIPRYAPVRLVALYLKIVSVPIPKRIRKKHLKRNRSKWKKLRKDAMQGKYIERQHLLKEMRYGTSKASFNSCEAIAAYNVMAACGCFKKNAKKKQSDTLRDLPGIFEAFEARGLVLGGVFGTATDTIVTILHKQGLATKELWGRSITSASTEELAGTFDAFVLSMYNDINNIFAQVHTVCITRSAAGYAVHNAGIPDRRFDCLYDAVCASHGGKGKEILLIGVKQ